VSAKRAARGRVAGEDAGVGTCIAGCVVLPSAARRRVLALLAVLGAAGALAGAACGDNLHDPFPGLVRVTGASPFAASCAGTPQQGTNFAGMEVEPSLAVDPTRPGHLVAAWQQDRWGNGGANGIGTAVSFDGGATWTTSTPRLGRCAGGDDDNGAGYDRATDPWVAFAADGTVFLAALVFDSTSARNAIVASRSVDGGLTWNDPAVLRADNDPDVFNDKEAITADPTDPGRVYVVWDRLTGQTQPTSPLGTGPTWFARTTDGAWEPARPIFDPGADAQTIGNVITVLPDGALINVFALITQTSSNAPVHTIAVIRSTDKGQTWSAPILIAPLRPFGVQDPNNHVFVRSGATLPELAVDRASGALYAVWQDAAAGATVDGIALARSLDGGLTWSAPRYLNGAPDAPAFTPGIAVAPDGTVGVTYYDARDARRSETNSFRVTAWLATSRDGGSTWSDEALGEPFDLRPASLGNAYFLGDYQGLVVSDGVFVPLFAAANQGSGGKTDVFVRPVR
jgi:hypothetical protein